MRMKSTLHIVLKRCLSAGQHPASVLGAQMRYDYENLPRACYPGLRMRQHIMHVGLPGMTSFFTVYGAGAVSLSAAVLIPDGRRDTCISP